MKKHTLAIAALSLLPFASLADYNANITSKVTLVAVYADIDDIYVRIENQPTSHPGCNPSYFVIDGAIPLQRRQMLLSRLMAAKATQESVNIGYDGTGDCASGYIRVHRVG